MPIFAAFAGPSRSGKGTCAAVFREEAAALGLTSCERQLSGPGKQYLADAFHPGISEEDAIAWFDEIKRLEPWIELNHLKSPGVEDRRVAADVSLQEYLQRMLQGARDRWGEDFWTDRLISLGCRGGRNSLVHPSDLWQESFAVGPIGRYPSTSGIADVAIISDLRQPSEAKRVNLLQGVVVEVHRPKPPEDSYVTGSDHVTEKRLPSDLVYDRIINDAGIEDLKAAAKRIFAQLVRRQKHLDSQDMSIL